MDAINNTDFNEDSTLGVGDYISITALVFQEVIILKH